jgi:hypothetical protein
MAERIRLTQKTIRFYTDNLWKRGVTSYYLPLFAVTLNRDYMPVVTKVTKRYIYQNSGRRYRLELTVVGFAVCVEWHSHHPKQERIEL